MVMILVCSFVVVAMAPALRDARLRSGCRTVASALIYARSYAITHRTETRVLLDKSEGAVSVVCRATDERGEETLRPILTQPGRRHTLPNGVKILSVRKTGVQEDEDYVCFTQFGQSEEAVISIEGAGQKERRVTVDPITGRCAVVNERPVQ